MAVKLTITVECVDLVRAKSLMDAFLDAIEGGMSGGDQAKLGVARKKVIGRRTKETKHTIVWVYGEDRPDIDDLGMVVKPTPMDRLLEPKADLNPPSEEALTAFEWLLKREHDDDEGAA